MKCQCLFSENNKENVFNLLSADLARKMLKVSYCLLIFFFTENKNKK